MKILYPRIAWRNLPLMLGLAAGGALLAGLYGAIHDEITYSLSEEYFTRLKFQQFRGADFGLHPRIFVAEIGFLATWWVGFAAAWFMARVSVPSRPTAAAIRLTLRGCIVMFLCTLTAGIIGCILGSIRAASGDFSAWRPLALSHGIEQIDRFVVVAYIHNAGYLGGLLGLILAIIYIVRSTKAECTHAA